MSQPLSPAVVEALASLTEAEQLEVIALAKQKPPLPKPPAKGTPGSELLRFAGTLSTDEADEMLRVIEEGCGQINHDAW